MSSEDLTPARVPLAAVSPGDAADTAEAPAIGSSFGDLPRLAPDGLLEQLRDGAGDVLATQSRLRGLLRANAVLVSELSLPSLLESLVEEACELLEAWFAAIVMMGANGRMGELVQVGMPAALRDKIQGHPSWREISALLGPDTDGEEGPETRYGSDTIGGLPPTGFFELPVRLGAKVYGRLYLRKGAGAVFTEEDQQVVTAFAATAAVALANASLFEESERRHRWLIAATGLADDLMSRGTIGPLALVCQYAMRAADADFATITLPDQTYAAGVAAATDLLADETLPHFKEMRRDAQLTSRTGKGMLVNHYGDDVDPAEADVRVGSVMVVPLAAGDHAEGALTLGRVTGGAKFSDADLAMAGGFATQAAVALAFDATRRTELHVAQLEDRNRIAMDLHDHVIQELFAVGMGLENLSAVLEDSGQVARVGGYIKSLNHTISTIRTRIFQLQPERHDPGGLQTQILELADSLAEQLGYTPQLHFAGSIDASVDMDLTDDILAVTREALSNCARHAHATSVTVLVSNRDGVVTLTITDNGVGLGTASRSSGLSHMRRRAERHGGTLTTTTPETGGTRLTWTAHL